MQSISLKKVFIVNTLFFFFFVLFFILFPKFDIFFSKLFFFEEKFISDKYIFIRSLRSFLKDLMIVISIASLLIIMVNFFFKNKKKTIIKFRTKLILIGFIVGPVIGCGLIANFYFKDNWGRARPINIQEFGGEKTYTQPFIISDQCERNCSWISGEASAAFSFITGTIILKNPIFFMLNIIFGIIVSFCRIAMGGHFLSDNIFAMIFMIYLAILYKYLVFLYLKRNV
jgi:lipid A 4'-phosphatase